MTSLDEYRLLGRSGLRVSPVALGTMTFGKNWGWGADATESRRIFDLYVDRGGRHALRVDFQAQPKRRLRTQSGSHAALRLPENRAMQLERSAPERFRPERVVTECPLSLRVHPVGVHFRIVGSGRLSRMRLRGSNEQHQSRRAPTRDS